MKGWSSFMIVFLLIGTAYSSAYAIVDKSPQIIENGKKVKLHFILKAEGEVINNTKEKGPLEYVHGSNVILPGLEKQLEGLKVGDKKEFTLSSQEAYGWYSSEKFKEVPKTTLPEDFDFTKKKTIAVKGKDGRIFNASIKEIKENSIVLDLNHPLAGKDLQYEVTILDIQQAEITEKSAINEVK